MTSKTPKQLWDDYCALELTILTPLLKRHGIILDVEQKHLGGERYLQQAVTTAHGRKLILTGTHHGTLVVIKATRDRGGKDEIRHEQICRRILHDIDFAASTFLTPEEILSIHEDGFLISVMRFIPQEKQFIEHTLEEQFTFALSAFKAQEGTHATTAKHRRRIRNAFGIRTAQSYLHAFQTFLANMRIARPRDASLHSLLEKALTVLRGHEEVIEQYTGFLTHTDFVPHNIRIHEGQMYLLDHSSLTFGNKYEGWARFLNFMTLYNPPLVEALTNYVRDNRTEEESVSLRMMRIYRLGEIIWYYTETLDKSDGDLHRLNEARITFWKNVLEHVLEGTHVPQSIIDEYKNTRDSLRSDDEKKRQQGLH
jgi:hypothetical protein